MSSKRWTYLEDRQARILRKQGLSHKHIGEALKRTEAGVRQQLLKEPIKLSEEEEISDIIISRTKSNFIVGELYDIDVIRGGLEFLPARFMFVSECRGCSCYLYRFQSLIGGYNLTFSQHQISNSYVITKVIKSPDGEHPG